MSNLTSTMKVNLEEKNVAFTILIANVRIYICDFSIILSCPAKYDANEVYLRMRSEMERVEVPNNDKICKADFPRNAFYLFSNDIGWRVFRRPATPDV